MKVYNTDKIVSVEVRDFTEAWNYYWQDYQKKTFSTTETKAGWYSIEYFDGKPQTQKDLEDKGYIFINNKPYEYPKVFITFVDKTWIQQVFLDLPKAKEYAESITENFHNKLIT